MNRRDLIKHSLAAGAAGLVLPRIARATPLPATPNALGQRDRQLFAIAKEQMEKHSANLWRTDLVGIADYGLRSSEPRFHFCNFETGKVSSFYVAHGAGSDPEHDGWLDWFSNVPESMCSSQGAYMTYGWYTGKYGTSIRLDGLDASNSNALDRAIVMHRAAYAEPAFLAKWGKLGRSNGCFAMSEEDFKVALLQMAGGRLLFADRLGIGQDGQHVAVPPADLRGPPSMQPETRPDAA
ncbi:murein L,D-transpeptidase catalytic domain family protein [Tsuneonella mangrovi]|uniref:murein L,D-transpeptidase catalytic domain family protein n=1 Tax=Tsuneonella mangrovi TaxID=1982042 RepID=UPI000BA2A06C|nr:murein L,D-transpeptidase catalytic domain family protein [Tsuneonella mangrovi]